MSNIFWIVIAGAVATYLTRIGGHVVLSRVRNLHPRVEAGLDAVPAAVLTTLVAPAATTGGLAELTALLATGLATWRFGPTIGFVAGAAALILLRNIL